MNEALGEVLLLGRAGMIVGFTVFLRVGAAMAVLPAFGERSVPGRVRLVLALAFTAIVAPAAADRVNPAIDGVNLPVILLGSEVVIGLALGMVLRLFVFALQIAGTMAAQSTSLSQIFGTAALEPMPAIGHVMVISGLTLAVMTGLHVRVAEMLIGSYALFPPGRLPDASVLSDWGLARTAHAFTLAFSLAAPFVIAATIYNLALGVINKAMPQLMVAFVGAPAITAGGLILLMLTLPLLLEVWIGGLNGFLANPAGDSG